MANIDLIKYRIDDAYERLEASESLLKEGHYKDSINRSYYAIFNAARSLLAENSIDYKRHTGIITHFQREYVKTGLFDKKYSDYISIAFQVRNEADYNDFYIASKEDAVEQLENAKDFCKAVREYLVNRDVLK